MSTLRVSSIQNLGGTQNIQSTSTTLSLYANNLLSLDIDSAGRIRKPLQPSFWAWTTTSVGSGSIIVYNNTQHNIGNHYNTANGRFTAPVSGRYMFTINSIGNTSGTCRLIPRINGNTTQFGLTQFQLRTSNGGNFSEGSLTFIWNLNANDYVDILNNETIAYSDTSGYLNWCGSLIG